MIFYDIKWKREGPFQLTDIEEPKLLGLGYILYMWLTAVYLKEPCDWAYDNWKSGTRIIEKLSLFMMKWKWQTGTYTLMSSRNILKNQNLKVISK
jgi:hypothetical protein